MQSMRQPLLFGAIAFLAISTQADLVLSNTNTVSGRQVLQRDISVGGWNATPITTDSFAYTVTAITAEILDANPGGTLFLEIWSVNDANAAPLASLGRLSLSQNAPAIKTFSGSISLLPDTSYFVVSGVDNGGGQWFESINQSDPLGTKDFNVDLGAWTLETLFFGSSEKTSYESVNFGASWQSDSALSSPLRMNILADVVPEPNVLSLLGLGGLSVIVTRRIKLAITASKKNAPNQSI